MLKKLSQCIGLASLMLVMNYGDLLGDGSDVRMHVPFALKGFVYAQLADIVLLGLLLFAVIWPLSRTRAYRWVQLALAIAMPPYLVERVRAELPFHLTNAALLIGAIVWAAVVLVLLLKYERGYRRLMRVGDFCGVFLAIFAACSVMQLLYVARWQPGAQAHAAAWETTAQPPRQHPLLVWVVFDELSYDQVYEHRARNLALPNFDALRGESTVYSDVQPVGRRTVKVLPSLLSGHLVRAYRFSFDNRLKVRGEEEQTFRPLTGAGTVFEDAKKEGWRTAAVGWYNPYCTLYDGAIDQCYWTNLDLMDGPMAEDRSFWQNTYAPLRQMVKEIVTPEGASRDLCSEDVRHRYETYRDLEQHTAALLKTDQADFVFLHLPVPHSPSIWSRKTGGFTQTCGGSYLDNLALADHELGRLMETLRASPRWKDTTLIVEGDHSWRTYLWRDQSSWTAEDEEASRGVFDPRPAMIVHRAGQTQPLVEAAPWSLLKVHAVVEQVIHGNGAQK